jgi:uncharacterized membrane protein YfcA
MDIFYFITIFILSIFQSIFGIGLLALGTPLFLLYNFSFEQTLSILLPCSMVVSIVTLLLTRSELKKDLDNEFVKNFLMFCLPSVMLGFIFVYLYQLHINLKLIIGFLILISVAISLSISKKIYPVVTNNKKMLNLIIGFIHGTSNVGGAFLSNYLLILNKYEKNKTRTQIAFAYIFFALIQYFFLLLLFNSIDNFKNIYIFLPISFFGVVIGYGLQKFIKKKKFLYIINAAIVISAFFLILKSFNV